MKNYKITPYGAKMLNLPEDTIIEGKLIPNPKFFKPIICWVEEVHDAFIADDESQYYSIHQSIKEFNQAEGMSEDQALRGADGAMKDFLVEIVPHIKKLNI